MEKLNSICNMSETLITISRALMERSNTFYWRFEIFWTTYLLFNKCSSLIHTKFIITKPNESIRLLTQADLAPIFDFLLTFTRPTSALISSLYPYHPESLVSQT